MYKSIKKLNTRGGRDHASPSQWAALATVLGEKLGDRCHAGKSNQQPFEITNPDQ